MLLRSEICWTSFLDLKINYRKNLDGFYSKLTQLLECFSAMAPRKGKEKKEEQVISLGPQVAEGENVFGVCHIFASFNDTFVHVTDLSGK